MFFTSSDAARGASRSAEADPQSSPNPQESARSAAAAAEPIKLTLLEFCERDDVEGASGILDPFLVQIAAGHEAAKDALLVKLFVDEYEEDTPVEAAVRIGSHRPKRAGVSRRYQCPYTQIRLYMLKCLTACGPLSRLKGMPAHPAHVPRLGSTIHRQVLRFMARLGALMRPYTSPEPSTTSPEDATSPPGSGGRVTREVIDEEQMIFWLTLLCELSHSEIALCVANAFQQEYRRLRECHAEFFHGETLRARGATQTRPRAFPNDRPRGNLGEALLTLCKLAKDADSLADRLSDSLRLCEAEKLQALSRRLQHAAATAVDALGADCTYLLIRHRRGQEAMRLAALEGMRTFLDRGAVRGALRRLWHGEKLHRLISEFSLGELTSYLGYAALNLAALPVIAATPMIEAGRAEATGWAAFFGYRENYLLQVACFQAFSFQTLDLLLTLYLTFLPTYVPLLGLLWAGSSVFFEGGQIRNALDMEHLSLHVSGIGAYLVQDIFNWIDVPTLLLAMASFGGAIIRPEWIDDGYGLGEGDDAAVQVAEGLFDPIGTIGTIGTIGRSASASASFSASSSSSGATADPTESLRRALRKRGGGGSPQPTVAAGGLGVSIDPPLPPAGQLLNSILSLAVLFMWFRQLRLLSLVSSNMSSLIQMLAVMILDVVKFMSLFVVILFAFAASLAHVITRADLLAASPDCVTVLSRLDAVSQSLPLLFEAALLGDVSEMLVCVRAVPGNPAMGIVVLFLFMIISILMLLNMIIAISEWHQPLAPTPSLPPASQPKLSHRPRVVPRCCAASSSAQSAA